MIIKRTSLKKAGIIIGSLLLIGLFVFITGPMVSVNAAVDACGDGICDTDSENNDLCPEDCQCIDNGVEDPGEGCGCKDVICEGEAIRSACGTPVGADGECPGNLVDSGGICWSRCECQGICSEADEAAGGSANLCGYSDGPVNNSGWGDFYYDAASSCPCSCGFCVLGGAAAGKCGCYVSGSNVGAANANACCSGSTTGSICD